MTRTNGAGDEATALADAYAYGMAEAAGSAPEVDTGDRSNGKKGSKAPDRADLSSLSSLSSQAQLPTLHDAALHGPAGDYVRAVEDTTEARPAGILATLLVQFGTMVGHAPYVISGERHHANLFAILVGATAKARKGTAIGVGHRLVLSARSDFEDRVQNGFGSGESVIAAVAPGEHGPRDHRLLVEEHEMSRVIKTAARQGSVLSEIVRDAYDGRTLRHTTLSRGTLTAAGVHIGVLGSITSEELLSVLAEVDISNGFINRFLILLVGRSQPRPRVRPLDDAELHRHAQAINTALSAAHKRNEVPFSTAGGAAYDEAYHHVTDDDPPGPLGKVVARADAHLTRLALVYALLDQSRAIEPVHIDAALAFWSYCRDSAALLWPTNPIADRIGHAIAAAGPDGLTRNQIRSVVGTNSVPKQRIDAALDDLARRRIAICTYRQTAGRPAETWIATAHVPDGAAPNGGAGHGRGHSHVSGGA